MDQEELRKRWGFHNSDARDKPEESGTGSDDSTSPSKYYGLELRNHFIASLKLVKRNGHVVYLPYSLQPVIEYIPENGIFIKTMQHEINITGRGLSILAEWLGSQKVKWIKQSTTGTDDETEDLFVETIEINPAFP